KMNNQNQPLYLVDELSFSPNNRLSVPHIDRRINYKEKEELHNRDYRLPMRNISSTIANSWKNESELVIEHYEYIAKEANKIFKK
ncbi:25810_t:CDS:2, partial [Racocetra persica]